MQKKTKKMILGCIVYCKLKTVIKCGVIVKNKNKNKKNHHPDSISPVKGSTEVWMISIIQEAFSYCYMSIFDLALRQHFIVVFVYFRVKYCDYSKSSGPGTEIIA